MQIVKSYATRNKLAWIFLVFEEFAAVEIVFQQNQIKSFSLNTITKLNEPNFGFL